MNKQKRSKRRSELRQQLAKSQAELLLSAAGESLKGLSATLDMLPIEPTRETCLEMLELFKRICKSQGELCSTVVTILQEAKQ